MVIHDTECPHTEQVSLKPKLKLKLSSNLVHRPLFVYHNSSPILSLVCGRHPCVNVSVGLTW